jgi:DNA polymerase III epsilon subunit-like protein
MSFPELEIPGLPKRSPPSYRYKLAWLDTETLGVNPATNAIIEIAIISESGERWQSKIIPPPLSLALATGKAMEWRDGWAESAEINGFRPEEWKDAPTAEQVLPEIVRRLFGTCVVGHNVEFDLLSLRRLYLDHGLNADTLIPRAQIDTMHLCRQVFGPLGLSRFNLQACCEFVGLEKETIHRAMGGCERAYKLFDRVTRAASHGVRIARRNSGSPNP